MKANKKLTQKDVDSAKPALKEYCLWDTQIPGFGLRVRPSGAKGYVYIYRYDWRKSRRYTIGNFNLFTVDEARGIARELAREVVHGEDPARNKAATRNTTVENIYLMYDEWTCSNWKQEHQTRVRGIFQSIVIPKIGHKPIRAVTRSDIRNLTDQKISDGKKAMANNIHRSLSAFFSWCVDREFLNINPLYGANLPFKNRSRNRYLDRDELVIIWRESEKLDPKWRAAIRLLMLTGQRRQEILGAELCEIDLDRQRWIIPEERSKNRHSQYIHLSPQSIAVLKEIPKFGGQRFLFQSELQTYNPRSIAKTNSAIKKLKTLVAIDNWHVHDLRRSVATHMGQLKIHPHVIAVVLNHWSGYRSGVTAIYNRYSYEAEAREAWNLWGLMLLKWVSDPNLPIPKVTDEDEVII
ncbi:MAG: site-specific integrase [Hahellaceae bacterium]|nr:site-specific integrase [Hahellaceae bacterium]